MMEEKLMWIVKYSLSTNSEIVIRLLSISIEYNLSI